MTQKNHLAWCHAIFNFLTPLLFSCTPQINCLFWKSCLKTCFWCGERQTLIRHLGVIFFAQTAVTRMFFPNLFSVGKTDIEESNSSPKSYVCSFRPDHRQAHGAKLSSHTSLDARSGGSCCEGPGASRWAEAHLLSSSRRLHLEASLLRGPPLMPFSGTSGTTTLSNGP